MLRNKKTGEEREDYEEPKRYWYIYGEGVLSAEDNNDFTANTLKVIGNYFETEEEAKKAIEKLKAWKRLKDVGCKFVLDDNLVVRFVTPNATKIETAEQQKSLSDDYGYYPEKKETQVEVIGNINENKELLED